MTQAGRYLVGNLRLREGSHLKGTPGRTILAHSAAGTLHFCAAAATSIRRAVAPPRRRYSCEERMVWLPVAFIVTWVVSLMTAPPSKEMQDFVDSIRIPKGAVIDAEATH